MTQTNNNSKLASDDNLKTIAIKVDARTHKLFKELAKFKGSKMQDIGLEAINDYIEWIIENEVKSTVNDLRQRLRAANSVIKSN